LPDLLEFFSYPQNVWITLWIAPLPENAFAAIPAFMADWSRFEQAFFPCQLKDLSRVS
jgi:hypothetical protein